MGKKLKLGEPNYCHDETMAFSPPELIIIGVIVVAFLVWGPGKIPEIARSLGRARREFEEASKGLTGVQNEPTPRIEVAASDPLVDTARKLGISTEGKTRQEISDAIVKAAQTK